MLVTWAQMNAFRWQRILKVASLVQPPSTQSDHPTYVFQARLRRCYDIMTSTPTNGTKSIEHRNLRFNMAGELAIVIGKTCKDVTEDEALDCVLGYTVRLKPYLMRPLTVLSGTRFTSHTAQGYASSTCGTWLAMPVCDLIACACSLQVCNDVSARCYQNDKEAGCPGNGGQFSFSKASTSSSPARPLAQHCPALPQVPGADTLSALCHQCFLPHNMGAAAELSLVEHGLRVLSGRVWIRMAPSALSSSPRPNPNPNPNQNAQKNCSSPNQNSTELTLLINKPRQENSSIKMKPKV